MTDPDREFHVAGERLGAALLGVIEPWVMRCAARVGLDPTGREAVETATACREWLEPRLLGLLEADVDAQTTTPLTLARAASAFPTELAHRQGILAATRSPRTLAAPRTITPASRIRKTSSSPGRPQRQF